MQHGEHDSRRLTLFQGAIFGIVFGFLLERGGAADYQVLLGALLLQDFTIFKLMLTAILVGTAGLYMLRRAHRPVPAMKKTNLRTNILGGLVFGAGFALLGYCPGTNLAALGAGRLDALFGVLGLLAGSYLYAEASRFASMPSGTACSINPARLRPGRFTAVWLTTLAAGLLLLELST